MNEQEFAQRLRQYRKNKGMTQQELADQLGVSNKTVSRWESGSYPDVTTLVALARVLGVTVDELLDPKAPVRTLEKSDWQNLLSFAFAIGGGTADVGADLAYFNRGAELGDHGFGQMAGQRAWRGQFSSDLLVERLVSPAPESEPSFFPLDKGDPCSCTAGSYGVLVPVLAGRFAWLALCLTERALPSGLGGD